MNNVLKIKDSSGNWIGIPAIRGEKGDKGDSGAIGESGTFPWEFSGTDGVTLASGDATYYTIPLADGKILVQCCTPSLQSASGADLHRMTSELPFTPIGQVFHLPFGSYAEMFFLEMEYTDNELYSNKAIMRYRWDENEVFMKREAGYVNYIPPLQFSYVAVPPTSEVN